LARVALFEYTIYLYSVVKKGMWQRFDFSSFPVIFIMQTVCTWTCLNVYRVSELIIDPITSCLYVTRSYGGTASRLQQHLHWPRHLTVDERGLIFVADCGNDRVLLLDEKLRLKRVMLSPYNGVKQPWRLCFVPETGILAVGSVTGCVELFLVGGETKRKK